MLVGDIGIRTIYLYGHTVFTSNDPASAAGTKLDNGYIQISLSGLFEWEQKLNREEMVAKGFEGYRKTIRKKYKKN